MQTFRIAKASRPDLHGTGGLYASGRWHTRGQRIVYTAGARALSLLEVLVHTDPEDVPDGLLLLTIEIPDDVSAEEVSFGSLPGGWRFPHSTDGRAIGDAWLALARTAVLHVPSSVAPEERNTLLNPAHPDAARIRIVDTNDFEFDPRLVDPRIR